MKFSKKTLAVLFSAVAVIAVFTCVKILRADSGSNMYGYLWSSNIGWIKLNDCTNPATASTCSTSANYGVTVLPIAPGTISGYGWSDNLGWITFNSSGCPTNGCTSGAQADWTHPNGDGSVNIKGWARACSVYAGDCSGPLADQAYLGGWDGYIALSDANAGGTTGWGMKINNDATISGFSWGSEVLGWIKSIGASINLNGLTVQMTATPATINQGDSSVLTVSATNIDNAAACSIQGIAGLVMSSGQGSVWSGTVSVSPAATTTYTVTCTKGGQTATASATVKVLFFGSPTGNNGNGNAAGAYCAITNPQLAWDTDATSCILSAPGKSGLSVAPSSKEAGGTLAADGHYYYSVGIPVGTTSTTYTLSCTGGAAPVVLTTTVNACIKDFAIIPTPSSQTLVESADHKKMTATFTVGIAPQYGFTDPVDLSIQSWPAAIPGSRAASFDVQSLTYNGSFNTAQLTISIDTKDLKLTKTFSPIIIKGVSGSLTRTAQISVGAIVKITPIFQEF
ncbi:MAG: hypothetical protein ABIO57_01130 [Candidatus Paceibacterota bacterium]